MVALSASLGVGWQLKVTLGWGSRTIEIQRRIRPLLLQLVLDEQNVLRAEVQQRPHGLLGLGFERVAPALGSESCVSAMKRATNVPRRSQRDCETIWKIKRPPSASEGAGLLLVPSTALLHGLYCCLMRLCRVL